MDYLESETSEWLEADGLGGFASGTASLVRTRRYHALLLAATRPPVQRFLLVNGLEAWLDFGGRQVALSAHRYAPDVIHPDGQARLSAFAPAPWPQWTFQLDGGARVSMELFVPHEQSSCAVVWHADDLAEEALLCVRPLLSGRDPHALHRRNKAFRFEAAVAGSRVTWQPYPGVPGILAFSTGSYLHAPDWYVNFLYLAERARGLDDLEDLASPGIFRFALGHEREAALILSAALDGREPDLGGGDAWSVARGLREKERARRTALGSVLDRAADAYIVRRGSGKTIVAGYPWFGDWGRDAFVALRGFCLAGQRLDDAAAILRVWGEAIEQGMVPNRFADDGSPEFNSADASLWFVVAAHEFMEAARESTRKVDPAELLRLRDAIQSILHAYAAGTRFGICADDDGLLRCGAPGVQLTWMDAKIGDWVVTRRAGKPVELQALWVNALAAGTAFDPVWKPAREKALASFAGRFWNEQAGCLYDVVDQDGVSGQVDASVRPNQIFAVGGLPHALLEGERARRVVDAVEQRLWTPMGLRTLDPGDPHYKGHYGGGVRERDGSYHQGTAWPWLLGAFAEAWVRVRGDSPEARQEARSRFLNPLLTNLNRAGIGHLSEIADGDPPHTPHGCPFQAWSVAEALRLDRVVLAE